jgi:nucleotide-binding universal stress UspA family protein
MMKKKFKILPLLAAVLFAGNVFAQNSNEQKALEYERTINLRAEKILKELNLNDSVQFKKVQAVMVGQYKQLNVSEQMMVSAKKTGDTIRVRQAEQQLKTTHEAYLQELSKELNAKQVEKIKDGMTYSVLPVTYKAYQDMIPSLKSDEKKQILDWLTEARELAMDQGTSDKKHQVFGKYKGRINNYLSARGYDLQKERKAWEERIKQQKSKG